MTTPRLLLDISTLLRHWERADGITRTQAKLAAYALDHMAHLDFVYLGGETPLLVDTDCVRLLLAGTHRIDVSHFRDPGAKLRVRDRLPAVLKSTMMWIQRPRRQAVLCLERIAIRWPRFASDSHALREKLLNEKYRRALTAPDGSTVHLVPHDLALRAMSAPSCDDVLILAGSDWRLMSNTLRDLSPSPKTAVLCYDIIPLLFPTFFRQGNVDAFRDCVENVFAQADLVIFNARQIAVDTRHYWQGRGLAVPPIETVALGADISTPSGIAKSLPASLVAQKYALFVSTIEPRKNHRLLFDIWKTLLDEGVPQECGFKLVFVGRKGWMVDDLWQEMTTHPCFGTSLLILGDIDDPTLASLYDNCAFTLYPSLYEGFGLPIVESFCHGKATIASSAGALLETVDGFSPCLSPSDETSWRNLLRQWIVDPSCYGAFERDIELRFSPRSWDVAAADFFRLIRERLTPEQAMEDSGSARRRMPIGMVGDVGLEPTTR